MSLDGKPRNLNLSLVVSSPRVYECRAFELGNTRIDGEKGLKKKKIRKWRITCTIGRLKTGQTTIFLCIVPPTYLVLFVQR